MKTGLTDVNQRFKRSKPDMLKFASRTLALIAFGFALFVSLFLESAFAQVYNNPVYIPAPLLAAQTLSAIGSVSYQVNSTGAVFVRFAGTNTGLIAEVDCTETRVAAPTWTAALALQPVGAGTGRIASVTANGLFWFNSSGFAQCRAKVTQLTTGSVTITFSGGPGRVIDTATI
jgi:hypothetical protein